MSVLIKGMELPKNCDDCEFCQRDISAYDWCCIPMVIGRSKPLDEPVLKPDWCPLFPVPPHGRLIDADATKVSLVYAEGTGDWSVPQMRTVLEIIDAAPTIIPAEEAPDEDTNVPGTYDILYEEGGPDTR